MKQVLLLLVILVLGCHHTAAASTKTKVLNKELLAHPRLLFTAEDQKRIEKLIQTEPLVAQLKTSLVQEADKVLLLPQIKYELRSVGETRDILMTSREYIYRLFTLSMAHRLCDNSKYIQHIEKTLLHICQEYPNWNPAHYLDVAEMTTAVAVAYDWCYKDLSSAARQVIKSTLKKNALDRVLVEYEKGGSGSWAKRETNWNVVCNTGMTLGALALAEDYPEIAETVVKGAAQYTPNCLKHFAPDGTCYEGPAYWGYTNIYLAMLLKSLDDNFRQCLGIDQLEGVSKSALFFIESASPTGYTFNFANSPRSKLDAQPAFFYFSRKFNQPQVATVARRLLTETLKEEKLPRWHFFLSLAWFDNSNGSELKYAPMQVFRGINDIIVLKGNPDAPCPIFLSGKGGAPDMAHQQLDVGSFVLEREGVRWLDDLGTESYALKGFWDYAPNGKRWSYFLNNNFSHNTLFIDSKLQHSAGRGKLTSVEESRNAATIEMSSVYPSQASNVERTFRLVSDEAIEIADAVTLLDGAHTVSFSAITSADVTISGNKATLAKDGKKITLHFAANTPGRLRTQEAKPYSPEEKPLKGHTLIIYEVEAIGKQTITLKTSIN